MPHLNKRNENEPSMLKLQSVRWYRAASLKRWGFFVFTDLLGLALSAALLNRGFRLLRHSTSISLATLWKQGFGQIDTRSLIDFGALFGSAGFYQASALSMSVVANIPQLVISVLHLNYNSLFTCMLMEKEWSDFAHERKALRVSSPMKGQRSSYFLSLPYTYAIPLIGLSGVMHWLVSESIFLAQITFYTREGGNIYDITTCGFSSIAIVFVIILGCLMLVGILGTGCRKYRLGMPLVGHCSAVISAVCQRLPEDSVIVTLPIKCGVISERNGIQHCAFSSFEVQSIESSRLVR